MPRGRSPACRPWTWVIAYSLGWLGFAFLYAPLLERLWVFVALLWLGYLGLGILLLLIIAGAPQGASERRRLGAGLTLVPCTIAGVMLFLPIARMGGDFWFGLSFQKHRPSYDRIVSQAQADPSLEGSASEPDFVVDQGPPIRVAFPQGTGIIDNWEAVIFDPARALEMPLADREKKLFGGDITYCSHIAQSYYRCWFT